MAKTTIFTASLLLLSLILSAKSTTIDLIHRDSAQSPHYNPSLTHSQRLANAVRRSVSHSNAYGSSLQQYSTSEPDIVNSGGEYLIKYSLGTPQVPSLGSFSTSNDLTWTQCSTCSPCFNQTLPKFDFSKSSTYKKTYCNEPSCKLFPDAFCRQRYNNCQYSEKFGDGSFTQGEIGTDTITLGPSLSSPGFSFGCGFNNGGSSGSGRSGVVGFGRGKGSVVNQLNAIVQGKFSYCLVPLSSSAKSSKLHLGGNALVSGPGVASTPLVLKSPDSFYYVTLQGISVGNQRVDFYDQKIGANQIKDGNMIIEPGTTITSLPYNFYNSFLNAVKSSIKLQQTQDPQKVLELCYSTKQDIQSPGFTVHFNGADVKLNADNLFARLSDDLVCLAVQSVDNNSPGVYGSLAQTNFLVGFDLYRNVASFKAADCSK